MANNLPQATIDVLLERRLHLSREILAIDFILGDVKDFDLEHIQPNGDNSSSNLTVTAKQHNTEESNKTFAEKKKSMSAKKDDMTWKDYILDVIIFMGGTAKVSELADVIVLSNPKVTKDRVRSAAGDKLPELVRDGVLIREDAVRRKDGHTYKVKPEILELL